nr:serine hydrolase [Candidatus Levybacteria bacterium]
MYEIQRFEKLERKKPSKIQNIFRGLLLLVLVIFTINILISSYLGKSSKNSNLFLSPLSTVKKVIEKTSSLIRSQENSKPLEQIVKNILKDNSEYSVYIKNLKTGERYYLNEDKQYETASLYKLWVMAAAYGQIEDGVLKKEDVLKADVSDLNDKFNIATESAELTDGSVSWSVEEAIKNMITISDNYSALLLSNKIKLKNVSQFLKDNGLLESKVGTLDDNPVSSAKDIGLFFEKLYNGELGNENDTNEMLDLLKNQQINTKLPKYLPQDAVIGHKTGELDKFSHDVGIVFLKKNDYVIVIMSKTDVPIDANEAIANVSKDVYEYFSK